MVQTTQHNMDCTDIKAMLSALVDGEVEPSMRHGAERHLAGCAPCRALLNEAEHLDQLLIEDYSTRAADALPMGFEQSVLSMMRDDQRISAYWRHWTTWAGWLAAAACLALASSMWITQNRNARSFEDVIANAPEPALDTPDRARVASTGPGLHRSWVHVPADDLVPDDAEQYGPPAPTSSTARPAALTSRVEIDPFFVDPMLTPVRVRGPQSGFIGNGDPGRSSLGDGSASQPSRDDAARSPLDSAPAASRLTEDDRDALYLASIVLDIIEHADLSSFSDIDEARQIVEYDGLLDRLAPTRERLAPADLSRFLAAEMVLLRAVQGPLDQQDARLLKRTVAEYDLSDAMRRLSEVTRTAPAI